jgi:hypothetical protein
MNSMARVVTYDSDSDSDSGSSVPDEESDSDSVSERTNSGGSTRTERNGTRSKENLRRSACQDLKCEIKAVFM